ncbi:hypothetical protein [Herpetosiphon geysericola]|uniref:Rieske domain-containing protein n=1 Tax=Herpetosiphon geysericola TaxID=70996 RepID=A0A0P6YCK8_9CHLR|nr:hypothetical protein [Herpetosiphon geysericola]KPL88110.1 hypothetical protein SE18_10310 [Herpetosiphon geysericola]
MSMLDPYEVERLERSRKRATRLLTLVMGLATLFCGALFVYIISPPARTYTLGPVSQFPLGQTVQVSVKQLVASETIASRPEVSDDPLLVTRLSADQWRVFLAWDSLSGCIVIYEQSNQTYRDQCSDRVYDEQGFLISENRRLRLGQLPVTVVDEQVQIRDELLPDPRQE